MTAQTTDTTYKISQTKQKKIDTVSNLTEKVTKAKALVLTDYRGLTHKQLEELRRLFKKTGAELVVAKNRLLKRAFGDKAETLKDHLTQPTATLFAYEDEVAPIRDLVKFLTTAGVGKPKGGLLGDQILTVEDVSRLSKLPTRNVLLARFVGQLNAPIQGLHYALSWNLNRFVWAIDSIKNSKS